ncbi:hypothetical protein [Acinetobacter stercoris]|uniref:DUF3244 domain-containing protein n=1 Tax=Acinetobacter stercoris TaxID=2126983 RepID=A0A2U3N3W4_9GAMM|nr:hypothetical protein [Acinetobacter stercoris]SPL72380.1 hypothetical protein KPC_3558 [Acinetobacter stercoris]
MKLIPIIAFLAISSVFASDIDIVSLSKVQHFSVNDCKIINSAQIAIPSKVSEFRMDTNDYLQITLIGKNSAECYCFKYYPDLSPYLDLKVKKNILYIIEMSGTASNGNWYEKRYKINIKDMVLTKIKK